MNPKDAIDALTRAGWTQTEIAVAVQTNQSTISRIAAGTVPTYPLGKALIDLAEREVRDVA